MAYAPKATRWGSFDDLVNTTGLAQRTLVYIREREPGVLVFRVVGKRTEYDIGSCNANLRKRERDKAEADAQRGGLDEAQTRKTTADAQLAELKVALANRTVIPIDEAAAILDSALAQLRSQLVTLPQRWAPMLVGQPTIAAATAQLDKALAELMATLTNVGLV